MDATGDDDLGYNDISTFGGGVGTLKTPGIDQLAAWGAVFTQSYSGASNDGDGTLPHSHRF